MDDLVQRCERFVMDGFKRDRSRPKKYWVEVIGRDITQLQLKKDITLFGRCGGHRLGLKVSM